MADRYWVGGAGTWDATTTTNWATTSGGAGGASAPTSADNVIFDSLSNATLYTVTIGTNAVCNDLTAAGPLTGNVTFSLPSTARLDPYGSMTLPATGLTWTPTSGALVTFRATTTGKTVTTNGVNLGATNLTFDGVGGVWTLGSALAINSSSGVIRVLNGTFDTGSNYSVTSARLDSIGTETRAVNLNGSTFTAGSSNAINITTTGLTLNTGTSTYICSNASPTFAGQGLTFYNVSFTSAAAGTSTITGANTFNDLSQTSRSATGVRVISLGANQTVSGTLTLGAANTSIRRVQVQSDTIGTQRTITLNGSLATLADCDFRDIATVGTVGTWTGTRIGNGLNNSGITFTAAKDTYWNLAAGGNWSATGWALSSGGAVDTNNFPLAQDKIIIENTGLNTSATITLDLGWFIGELNLSTRSNAMTLAIGTQTPRVYKSLVLSSAVTITGAGAWSFLGFGTTQNITTAGITFDFPIIFNSVGGTIAFQDALTQGSTRAFTITNGTVQLKHGVTSTVGAFATSGTTQKFLQSTLAGTQATLSQASGTVNASYLTIQDINATGGATWNSLTTNNNVDDGNNDGWDFGAVFPAVLNVVFNSVFKTIFRPVF